MMHQKRGFRDKYLAPLLITLLLAFCGTVKAQVYQSMPNRYNIREARFDSSFELPFGTTPSLRSSIQQINPGRLFYKTSDSSVQVWTGTQWLNVGGGTAINWGNIGGTLLDQTDLNTALNTRLKYTDTAMMLYPYLRTSAFTNHTHLASQITDFTTAARNTVSQGSGISYNPATGVISATAATTYTAGYGLTGGFAVDSFTIASRSRLKKVADSLAAIMETGRVTQEQLDDTATAIRSDFSTAGVANTNAGFGYRWLKPSGQGIKTSFNSWGVLIDSTSNTDGLTYKVDSSVVATKDYVNAQVLSSPGITNANTGTGYRILKPGTQEIKTLYGINGVLIDSITNSNGLTLQLDSSKYATQFDLTQISTGVTQAQLDDSTAALRADFPTPTGSDGNNYPTAVDFNTSTGNLTIDRNGLSTLSKNLDGRYALLSNAATNENYLANPGIVTWSGSGLTFDVTPALYYINGVQYTSGAASVTLNAADATNPRIDVIAVDNTGAVVKITGDAASSPVKPQIDPTTQVELSFITIDAGATTPTGVSTTVVYDENTEWSLVPQGITIDANNATSFNGSKAISTSGWSNLNQLTLVNGSALQPANYVTLKLFVRLKSTLSNSANITATLANGSTIVSNEVFLTGYGLTKSTVGSYQNISIPFSALNPTGTFDRLRIRFPGSNSNGVYVDYVQLQNGVVTPPPSSLQSAYAQITDGTNTSQSSGSDKFKFRSSDNTITTTVSNNDATHGDNLNLTVNGANVTGVPQSGVTGLTSALAAKEDVANKSTSSSLGTSNTLYPTQNAVKAYVDAAIAAAGGYTDEQAQDAVGAMVSSEFTYTDATPSLAINTIAQSKVTNLTTDLAAKQATLVSGTNIKTINGSSLLGSGDLTVSGGLTNPMTAAGDIIYGGASGTPTRLPPGGSGYTLKYNTTTNAPEWLPSAGGIDDVLAIAQSLSANRTITTGSFGLSINSTGSTATLTVSSLAATGLSLSTSTGLPAIFVKNPSTTNTIEQMMTFRRSTSAAASAGIGGKLTFESEITSNTKEVANLSWVVNNTGNTTTESSIRLNAQGNSTDINVLNLTPQNASTTDATPTTLQTISVTDETVGVIEVYMYAKSATTSGGVTGKKIVRYRKDGGVLSLGTVTDVLSTVADGDLTTATWTISTNSNNIIIQVTGEASKTIAWTCVSNYLSK